MASCALPTTFVFQLLLLAFIILVQNSHAKEAWGIVLVDLRPSSRLFHRTVSQLQLLHNLEVKLPIELWIHKDTILQNRTSFPSHLQVRHLNLPNAELGNCCGRSFYGYISKAYALLHSAFATAVFFDSDVFFLPPFQIAIDNALRTYPRAHVLWTLENNFQCFRDGNASLYITPSLSSELSLYENYTERNTGTIVAIRKSPISQLFLTNTISLWTEHMYTHISNTDQGAFRESAFLHRQHLQEAILDPLIFCRETKYFAYHIDTCSTKTCAMVHYAAYFDTCIAMNRHLPSSFHKNVTSN